MSGKHTPGPWRVGIGSDGFVKAQSDAKLVASVYGDAPTCEPDERMVANTRLIAAAPDLLEALRECVGVLTEPGIMDVDEWKAWSKRTVQCARAAIAKAEGENGKEAAP